MVVAFYSYRSTLKNMPWELIMSKKITRNNAQTQLQTSDSNIHCMIQKPCVFQVQMKLKQ